MIFSNKLYQIKHTGSHYNKKNNCKNYRNTLVILATNKTNKYVKICKFSTNLSYKLLKGENNHNTGNWIKDQLIDLGPTYVKIGQLVSSRPDLFPKYITTELESLQDNVPVVQYSEIVKIIENEFNSKITDTFDSFSTEPIASASISQVHTAVLKNSNITVAVKVQRPNIETNFREDLEIVSNILYILKYANNKNINDLLLILNECTASIEQEINFLNEMNNMYVFQNIFTNDDYIKVPKVNSKLTTKRVIVMEYLPSIKITDVKKLEVNNINNKELANKLMLTFIENTLQYGYLHSDPHAGNIGITTDDKIVLYDFGIVAKFDMNLQDTFNETLYALMENNATKVINITLKNDIIFALDSNAKTIENLSDYEYVVFFKLLGYIFEYLEHLDLKKLSKQIRLDPDINENNIPFIFNSKMILLFKSMTTLEGVCKILDPEFTYDTVLSQVVIDLMDTDFVMNRITSDFNSIINNFVDVDTIKSIQRALFDNDVDNTNDITKRIMPSLLKSNVNTSIDKDKLIGSKINKLETHIVNQNTLIISTIIAYIIIQILI